MARSGIANACTNPDLFWALKGGGGGTFGVVTRVTLRTHDLPDRVRRSRSMSIHAASDDAFRRLLGRFVNFYATALFNPNWAQIVNVRSRNTLDIDMEFQGIDKARAEARLAAVPRLGRGSAGRLQLSVGSRLIADAPARRPLGPAFLEGRARARSSTTTGPARRKRTSSGPATWPRPGHFLHGYESVWLPAITAARRSAERVSPMRCSPPAGIWPIELHFQKGLAGAPAEAIAATARHRDQSGGARRPSRWPSSPARVRRLFPA